MSGLPEVRFGFGILPPLAAHPPGPIGPVGPLGPRVPWKAWGAPGARLKPDIRYSWHIGRAESVGGPKHKQFQQGVNKLYISYNAIMCIYFAYCFYMWVIWLIRKSFKIWSRCHPYVKNVCICFLVIMITWQWPSILVQAIQTQSLTCLIVSNFEI